MADESPSHSADDTTNPRTYSAEIISSEGATSRAYSAEIASLEAALRDSEARNASLEALCLNLVMEAEQSEVRRSRERQLRRSSAGGMEMVPRHEIDSARAVLEEGSKALVAAHEHTLRLAEMRIAAMAEQLARCASALPAGAEPIREFCKEVVLMQV